MWSLKMEPVFIYKRRVKCFKCSCSNCGCDRGYQPKRNINSMCTPCRNKLKGPKSESFKQKISLKMIGNKNSCRPSASVEVKEERKIKYSKEATIRCRNKYKEDIDLRIKCVLRSRIKAALKGNFKISSAVRDLGCSIEDLKKHIESKFQPEMTWENWGQNGWHLDHIKPLCSFNLTNIEEFKIACHYTNLQPLWARDNIAKGGK